SGPPTHPTTYHASPLGSRPGTAPRYQSRPAQNSCCCLLAGNLMYLLDTLPDPAHHRHGHAVSQRLVARTIWAELGWFATPRNQRVVVGEALQAFALAGGEAAHGGCKDVRLIAAPRRRAQATGKVVAKFCGCAAVAATERNTHCDCRCLPDMERSSLGVEAHGDYGVLASGFSGAPDSATTCCKARSNIGGKAFPRLSARRRMPRQAVALKKYRCGSSPVSKMSDNEHTAASLGHSEVL